eukprot:595654_1
MMAVPQKNPDQRFMLFATCFGILRDSATSVALKMENGGFLQQISETTASKLKPVVGVVDPLCNRVDSMFNGVYQPIASKASDLHTALDSDHDGSVSVMDLYNAVGTGAMVSVKEGVVAVKDGVDGAVSTVAGGVQTRVSNMYNGVVEKSAQSVNYWLPAEKEGKKAEEEEPHSLVDVYKNIGTRVFTRVEAYSAGPLKQQISIDLVAQTRTIVTPVLEKGVVISTTIIHSFGSHTAALAESFGTHKSDLTQALVGVPAPLLQHVPFKMTPKVYISEVRVACSGLGDEVASVLGSTQAIRAPMEACALMLILCGLRSDQSGKYDDLLEQLTMTTKTLLDWSKVYVHKNQMQQLQANGIAVE